MASSHVERLDSNSILLAEGSSQRSSSKRVTHSE